MVDAAINHMSRFNFLVIERNIKRIRIDISAMLAREGDDGSTKAAGQLDSVLPAIESGQSLRDNDGSTLLLSCS
jgi:hypothetical protein